ncbi:hypothetical protein GIB67_019688, partial [Kingdonia uniflora]
MVVTSASVHSLSQDFSLPGKAEGPDLEWYMEWTGRREMLPITRLRDPLPMSSSYGTEELWHLTHGMRRLVLAESARDTQRLQEFTDELVIVHMQINSIYHQLYAHLRRGRNVRVIQPPPKGGARTRQGGSGLQTRGGGSSRRGRGFGGEKNTARYLLPRSVLFTAKSLISKPTSSTPFTVLQFTLRSSIGNLFTIWYYTLLSTPQPQMYSSSSNSTIPDPPGLSSSSSSDDLILDCAATICILHQAAMNIVVEDATSSYDGSVMGH